MDDAPIEMVMISSRRRGLEIVCEAVQERNVVTK